MELKTLSENLVEQLADIPREDLFTVDGVQVTQPCWVTAGVMLSYNRVRSNQGNDMAVTWALELMLGAEGLNRLIASAVTDEQLDKIITAVIGRIRGATRGEPGKGDSKTPPKSATSSRSRSTRTPKSG